MSAHENATTSAAPPLRSRWAADRPVLAVLLVAAAAMLNACAPADPDGCEQGRRLAEDAVAEVLHAAKSQDAAAAATVLVPDAAVDPQQFERLHDEVAHTDIAALQIVSERMGGAQILTVIRPDGRLVGYFEVHDAPGGCYAVAWGDITAPAPDPAVSQPALPD